MSQFVKWFEEIGIEDVPEVGGKNASLGEMYRNLTGEGVRVPHGFAVTATAYRHVLEYNGLEPKLHAILDGLDYDDVKALQEAGAKCRELIHNAKLPEDLKEEILSNYGKLKEEYGENVSLAVRSSATAEDSPEASFAGQNDTYLNIKGDEALLDAYKRCLASNFTDRSLHYKHDNDFDWAKVYLSVVVMKMVRSDLGASGVMFSLDTETGFRDVVFINAAYGLGENVVQGTIDPDSFYVHKPTYEKGYRAVLKRRLGKKELKMVFTDTLNTDNIAVEYTKNVPTSEEERSHYCISDDDVMVLADYAIKVERHYSEKAGYQKPMDMEWAKDGEDGHLYMVQARPETVQSQKKGTILEIYHLKERGKVLVSGRAVGTKIGQGRVHYIPDVKHLSEFKPGEVLVADTTTPDWEPVMKTAAAIVTNKGGRTCHAAIVSRELGIPAVVGAEGATEILKDGQEVTVSCAEGETGYVYEGLLLFEIEKVDLSDLPKPKTEIMMNLGNPDQAFSLASLPVDGIGLARMEFIINEYIKAHPMALKHPEKVDEETRRKLEELSRAYEDMVDFFVKTLSEGVATIAAAVYPKPCVVRMSDFKTNEYATLLGGKFFEPEEDNPMIGFRGAARYTHPAYEEGFALECAAMKRAREVIGMENIILMIPFCRRVPEGEKVVETMAKYGLKKGEKDLKIYVMCEIPNNVIQIDEFSKTFDGFSIGSNDLTQLTLGVDRDSEIVAFDYDERDPGVLKMIEMAVKGCQRNHRHSGICGQAPSDYPEVAEFLVKLGIDSMSLNPDSVLRTIQDVVKLEEKLGRK
ncbi:phosphoenolpyruvate synthase [Nitratifractor salsuginis]|uniref:Phosphoenolpyruvate synthase n=1 Tax=Nitratifractor salsuginis (strain DSM 16511 / JCM 12458 / E9I37-1) TaxID=749222 RepID=E6X3E9_NITSE|nr:phosphoenolpyruvate synthase [Nitratifractor salsuginis]ADV46226.1 phosphoenolpyruvate synthase [Nitratifractor salsuginis DSM 16511]